METTKQNSQLLVSRFDVDQKIFYLKTQSNDDEVLAVSCNINLQGITNNIPKFVDTTLPLSDYEVFRFINPYLNAENDLFIIKVGEKSIGYLLPSSALEENDLNMAEEFDEIKQAYKYYCIKSVLEHTNFINQSNPEVINFSSLVNENSIFAIIYKPQIKDPEFKIENCLPSFAIKGYYYFPENAKPSVLELASEISNDTDFSNLIDSRFLIFRNSKSIKICSSKNTIGQNPMILLLYKKLLVESNNPLHRFLILYQVIEFLVDQKIREGIEEVLNDKDSLTNFNFFKRINEINNTRSTINKLFDEVNFDEKADITSALRDFILIFESEFKSQATGDCIYDIRNLLFHDFKSVLEKNEDGAITSLVIQYEILIHQLLTSLGKEEYTEDLLSKTDVNDSDLITVSNASKRKWYQFWKS